MKHLIEENRRKDIHLLDLQQQVEQWRTKANDLYIEVEILNKTVSQLKVASTRFLCVYNRENTRIFHRRCLNKK